MSSTISDGPQSRDIPASSSTPPLDASISTAKLSLKRSSSTSSSSSSSSNDEMKELRSKQRSRRHRDGKGRSKDERSDTTEPESKPRHAIVPVASKRGPSAMSSLVSDYAMDPMSALMFSAFFKPSSKGNQAVMDTPIPVRQVMLAATTLKVEQMRSTLRGHLTTLKMLVSKYQQPGGPAVDRRTFIQIAGLEGAQGEVEISRVDSLLRTISDRIDSDPKSDPLANDDVQIHVSVMMEFLIHMKTCIHGKLAREIVDGVASMYEATP